MFLLVGLGNPGREYVATRHNAGFLALDYCAEQLSCRCAQEKWQGLYGRCQLGAQPLLLLKPQTYMNRSGICVARFADFYSISPAQLLVLHDDLDMPPGRIKIVGRGGAGGHNGIRSLIASLGTDAFVRLKIGIGRPGSGGSPARMPVEHYVLHDFFPEELTIFQQRCELVWEGIRLLVTRGLDAAMNHVNAAGQVA